MCQYVFVNYTLQRISCISRMCGNVKSGRYSGFATDEPISNKYVTLLNLRLQGVFGVVQ
ncbi:hypothetical protein HMPREF0080_02083 [Anaeroglobus geminatus F0357]|uniref:Uncharacterized protein n=1 Tax=Anaeroglobus geminatus F0357 TaxID=861450 RepID=G9YK73_9FIRM|nr:hypothetical protein HMPREF0080_02083 [Anaeroglobus geminatus F0357]